MPTGWVDLALSLVGPAIVIGFVVWSWISAGRKRRAAASGDAVADPPEGNSYRVFTRSHDLILPARNVCLTLNAVSPDRVRGWLGQGSWWQQIDAARDVLSKYMAAEGLAKVAAPHDWAVCLLVDQSGSMRGSQIAHAAAAVRHVSDMLQAVGVSASVCGFSTVGWHGGAAANAWAMAGRSKRPGRLCALLHIIYQEFGSPMVEEDWEAMLNPDILRENVDGEAIEWAVERLRTRPEPRKVLIVISDGAPVDDATLLHNGPSFLWSHLVSVIDRIEQEGDVVLAGVGIEHDVKSLYSRSVIVSDLVELDRRLIDLITEIFASDR